MNINLLKISKLFLCLSDIRDYSSYPGVVEWVGGHLAGEGLNVLVNNAGIAHWQGFEDITREHMLDCLETNAIVPLMMAKVLYSFLNIFPKYDQTRGLALLMLSEKMFSRIFIHFY